MFEYCSVTILWFVGNLELLESRTSCGSRHCSLRVLQLVVGEHAASPHAPCVCRCCCGPMLPRHVIELRTSRTPAARNQTQAAQQ